MLLPLRRQPHRPLVQRRHRHHLRLLQKMRRPDKRQQRKVVPRQQQRKHQRRQAVRRLHLRAKLLLNPRQRVPKQRQNGQRILLMPYLWKMRVRRKKVWFSSVAPLTARLKRWLRHQKRLRR
ncbi:putative phage tail fiber protein [Escherichia coli MP021561.2]|nr:putative phage tail fiber protein [Escherichia coli MP021561.2]KDZ76936.1 putative phage tail fiber protein [Escherichia coli 3-073-06_S4_C3]